MKSFASSACLRMHKCHVNGSSLTGTLSGIDMSEQWKWVPGFVGWYKVSTMGRVKRTRSLTHYRLQNGIWTKVVFKPRLLGTKRKTKWYPEVCLRKKGKRYRFLLHQLVMLTFVGPCPDGMEVCHNNDKKHDNRLSNLRYDTPTNNRLDAIRNGVKSIGSQCSFSTLNEDVVTWIRLLYPLGATQKALASAFRVSPGTVSDVICRKTWKHVA